MTPLALALAALLAVEPADADAGAAPGGDAAVEAGPADAGAPKKAPPIPGEKRAPAALLRYLRQHTVGAWCDPGRWRAPAPLEASRALELRDGGLLVFVQVPDYLCTSTNSAVPVIVSAAGEWRWGLPLDGAVNHVARSEDGTLWATSQWQIEGIFPKLFRSRDGLAWKEVPLPEERGTTGPFETVTTLCFGVGTVVVKLHAERDEGEAVEVWGRGRADDGGWARQEGVDQGCLPPQAAVERWSRDASLEDRVLFRRDGVAVSVPKVLRPR